MFNQKVNGYISENPDYINQSYSGFTVPKRTIHNCGTTINKYTKEDKCASLPLQKWCSPHVAVESFAMRPIFNPKEYFESINKYLSSIIYTDSIKLKRSGLTNEHYYLYTGYGDEPESSFIQAIKSDITDKISYYMSSSVDQVGIFKDYNPICEGFVITDIDIVTYRSHENTNHFFHKILFSAMNTTRYNTISFKAEAYQDTTPIMKEWNDSINKIMSSKDTPMNTSSLTDVYISLITLMNNTNCVVGQENDCEFTGYNLDSQFSQLLNEKFSDPPSGLQWKHPDVITQNVYNEQGNYDEDGYIRIYDFGPSNLDQLINQFKNKSI
jgi:hypothetical protein